MVGSKLVTSGVFVLHFTRLSLPTLCWTLKNNKNPLRFLHNQQKQNFIEQLDGNDASGVELEPNPPKVGWFSTLHGGELGRVDEVGRGKFSMPTGRPKSSACWQWQRSGYCAFHWTRRWVGCTVFCYQFVFLFFLFVFLLWERALVDCIIPRVNLFNILHLGRDLSPTIPSFPNTHYPLFHFFFFFGVYWLRFAQPCYPNQHLLAIIWYFGIQSNNKINYIKRWMDHGWLISLNWESSIWIEKLKKAIIRRILQNRL